MIFLTPPPDPGPMILTNLNLYYPKRCSCKSEPIALNNATLFLHFCDYLSFEENQALYLNKLEFNLYNIDFTMFDWNWIASSGVGDFWRKKIPIKTHKNDFPIVPPPDPEDHEETWICLCQNAFM
jgi:hypothetical protein